MKKVVLAEALATEALTDDPLETLGDELRGWTARAIAEFSTGLQTPSESASALRRIELVAANAAGLLSEIDKAQGIGKTGKEGTTGNALGNPETFGASLVAPGGVLEPFIQMIGAFVAPEMLRSAQRMTDAGAPEVGAQIRERLARMLNVDVGMLAIAAEPMWPISIEAMIPLSRKPRPKRAKRNEHEHEHEHEHERVTTKDTKDAKGAKNEHEHEHEHEPPRKALRRSRNSNKRVRR